MKTYIYLILLFFINIQNINAQVCTASVDFTQDLTVQDSCCYFVTFESNECVGFNVGNVSFNTSNLNPCQISSLSPISGTTTFLDPNHTFGTIEGSGGVGVWNNIPNIPLTIAEICFENGMDPISTVQVHIDITDVNGSPTDANGNPYFTNTYEEVDASCGVFIPDCSCMIDFQPLINSDCCYEVGVQFTGPDCNLLNFNSLEISSNIAPALACDISLIVPYAGFGVTQNTSTFGSFTSNTNMGNTSAYQVLGQVCFIDPVNMFASVINGFMVDQSGSFISCDETFEEPIDCVTEPPLTPLEKLLGDSIHNIATKIIDGGGNKVVIIGNQLELSPNDDITGFVMQVDLITHNIDFITQGPNNVNFNDIALNTSSGELFIVGHTLPSYGIDNNSVIIKIVADGTGSCDKVDYFDNPGTDESFSNIIIKNNELYISGKYHALSGSDISIMKKLDANCSQIWNYEYINNSTYKNLVSIPGGGIINVGDNMVELNVNGTPGSHKTLVGTRDVHVFANGDKMYFGSSPNGATITLWDANDIFLDGKIFNDLVSFHDYTTDQSKYYAVGTKYNPGFNLNPENHIVEFKISGGQIIVDNRFVFNNGATIWGPGSINFHKDGQYILYADGRDDPNGFGNFDLFFGAYDNLFSTAKCLQSITPNDQPYSTNLLSFNINLGIRNPPSLVATGSCSLLDLGCAEICGPLIECEAKFTWEQTDCHEVQFTDASTSTGTITSWSWSFTGLSGQSTSQNPIWDFNFPGAYNVCLDITTSDGCSDQYCENIIVVAETQSPTIICNADIYIEIPACERGKIVTFSNPIAQDTCSNVTIVCSHQSGDFFLCGSTIVTCTATDDYGNIASCSFVINVTCECAIVESAALECSEIADQFYFNLVLEDISGATSCSPNISIPSTLGNLNIISQYWVGNKLYANGSIDAIQYPFPTNFGVQVDLSCICPDQQPHNCTIIVNYTTPCCDKANMTASGLCKDVDESLIDINFFGTVNDIVQIDYYVENGPCPANSWNTVPYQTSLGYQPLRVLPRYHTTDICITAVVTLGTNELPCMVLTTDTISYTLCSGFDCSLNNQEFCYTGIPITPAPIVYSGTLPDCEYEIEWFYPNGNSFPTPSDTTTNIQPTALDYNGPPGACYQDYTYEMRISGECPTISCTSTIRLWNDDADVGILYLDPIENLPLCYGEDVSIRYDEQCSDPTMKWTWLESIDGVTFNPIPTAGDANEYYNSNRLYQNHWYQVEQKNGLCPEKTVDIHIPVKTPFSLTSFTAFPYNPCRDNGLKLNVNGTSCQPSTNSVCDCSFTIDVFKNGVLITSIQSSQPTAGYSYIDPLLNGNYSGIYYVEVTDNCCGQKERSNTVTIRPPIKLGIIGPCYICVPGTQITLSGIVKNGPADGTCTYQWYYQNQIWGGGNSLSLTTTKPGLYRLEMTCVSGSTSCTKIANFEVMDCSPVANIEHEIENFDFTLAPNPSFESTFLIIEGETLMDDQVIIYNLLGKVLQSHKLFSNQSILKIEDLKSGTYLITINSEGRGRLTKKLIIL